MSDFMDPTCCPYLKKISVTTIDDLLASIGYGA
jgi:hypothetical protein